MTRAECRARLVRGVLVAALLMPFAAALAGPDIQQWRTGNGASVLFAEAPEIPMVDVRVVFDAGGAQDGASAGIAQLTNAMLAEGAGGMSAQTLLENFGRVGAEFEASSLRDMAWLSVRSITREDHLQPALDNLATVIARPDFPADAFERLRRQMLVGLQDEQQSPGDIASRLFYENLYGDHPYGQSPDGTEASINALTIDDARTFHRRFYVARNAVVAIVGAVDRKRAAAIAETVVGALPAGQASAPPPGVPARTAARTVRYDFPASQTHLLLGQPGMSRTDPDYHALYLANHVLGGSGLVSILSDEIREQRGLSYSVYSYFSPMRGIGPFTAGLQTRNEKTDEALRVVRETIRAYLERGPSDAELLASKKNITGGFPLRIDSNSEIVEYLALIGFYGLPLDYLDTFPEKIQALSRDEVADAMRRRIDVDSLLTVIVGGGAEPSGAQARAD